MRTHIHLNGALIEKSFLKHLLGEVRKAHWSERPYGFHERKEHQHCLLCNEVIEPHQIAYISEQHHHGGPSAQSLKPTSSGYGLHAVCYRFAKRHARMIQRSPA
ncbi:MAG TPA: hypothetical protein PLZ57_12490 [Pseudobdellovibrionaceae bacterium]|nr:hypothetical protein [Pseudobdellovibrionaceae bacterium]